jgi:hypothetical protein
VLLAGCASARPPRPAIVGAANDPSYSLPARSTTPSTDTFASFSVRSDASIARRVLAELVAAIGRRDEAACAALFAGRIVRMRGGTTIRDGFTPSMLARAQTLPIDPAAQPADFFVLDRLTTARVAEQRARFGELTRLAPNDVVVAVPLTPIGTSLFQPLQHGGTFEMVLRIDGSAKIVGLW